MSSNSKIKAYLKKEGVKDYQKHLFDRFDELIATSSVELDSEGRILKGKDKRSDIKKQIEEIKERHGLGIAMLVLHAQQLITGHIPLEINGVDLAVPTLVKPGVTGEQFLKVAVRKYRNDMEILKKLGIVSRLASKFISHETDGKPCFYCSCAEMNHSEVVIDHSSDSLNDDYRLGFTFAPFGRPDQVVHFLAWNRPKEGGEVPNMTVGPTTYSDLVQLVIEINTSIKNYFKKFPKIKDAPIIDGIHNGFAGNTLYHNHYQFFTMEYKIPVLSIEYSPIGTFGKVSLSKSSD